MLSAVVKTCAPGRHTAIRGWAGLPLAVLLTGCFSNEPSSDEMLGAIRGSRSARQALMLSYPGVNFNNPASVERAADQALNGAKVEKLGCTPPPPGMAGLLCEFRIGLNTGSGQLRYSRETQRFLKVNGRWQIPG